MRRSSGPARRIAVLLVAVFGLVVAAAPGAAQGLPFSARIESVDGEHACNASLIAPGLALTAAHCAGSSELARPFRHSEGGPVRQTREVHRHPVYSTRREGLRRWRYGLALVVLDAQVAEGGEPRPLPVGAPPVPGEVLTLETWRIDQERILRRPCPVTGVEMGIAFLRCAVRGGDSVGPAVRMTEDGPELVAVTVARAGPRGAIATPVAPRLDVPMEAARGLREPDGPPTPMERAARP